MPFSTVQVTELVYWVLGLACTVDPCYGAWVTAGGHLVGGDVMHWDRANTCTGLCEAVAKFSCSVFYGAALSFDCWHTDLRPSRPPCCKPKGRNDCFKMQQAACAGNPLARDWSKHNGYTCQCSCSCCRRLHTGPPVAIDAGASPIANSTDRV